MYKIVSIVCIIAAAACCAFFLSWLKSRMGTGKEAARLYGTVHNRNTNFWNYHLFQVIALVVLSCLATGLATGWKNAAACLTGAVVSFACIYSGSLPYVRGSVSSYNESAAGDIRSSIKASYRSGAVTGLFTSALCLAVMLIAFSLMKGGSVMEIAAPFAFGAAVVATMLHTGGDVYSSSYSLAVSSRDYTDRAGYFAGAGADYVGSFILAAASTIMLADVAVATSGVTSTFTNGTSSRFILVVYAAGIAGSVAGVLMQRAGLGNDPSRGADIGCIAAGIIAIAICMYFSMDMMQSFVYAWSVAAGIVAGILLSEISRFFSSDNKIYVIGKNYNRQSRVLFNLGSGMITTAVYSIILLAAIIVSYNFASFYGLALCAAGMCSILGSVSAVSGLSILSTGSSDILSSGLKEGDENMEKMSDALFRTAVKTGIIARTYRTAAGSVAAMAIFYALSLSNENQVIDIMSLHVFGGIIVGACSAFVLTGMLIGSVRVTSRVAMRAIGRNDEDTGAAESLRGAVLPVLTALALTVVIGLFCGVSSLTGFIISVIVTGSVLITTFNNSGMYFENTAVQSLSSVIKLMAVFSAAFLPFFMKIGGLLF